MGRAKFDRFMVDADNGRNLKLARFTDAEFRALVQGVWPIAAKADPRGAFMVGHAPATADDVAFMAPKVSKRTASACLSKMRELGMLEFDDELGGEWVHDWDIVNPAPKTDRTNADRQRRFRERRNAVTQGVTERDVTPPEVKKGEGEGERGEACARDRGAEASLHPALPLVIDKLSSVDGFSLTETSALMSLNAHRSLSVGEIEECVSEALAWMASETDRPRTNDAATVLRWVFDRRSRRRAQVRDIKQGVRRQREPSAEEIEDARILAEMVAEQERTA